MKRKVIQLAGRTLVVSLPSKWAKNQGIHKGNEVEVTENSSSLVISSKSEPIQQKTKLSVAGLDPMIKRILGALYKIGYSECEVQFDTVNELRTIQEVVREEFIGFEITHMGKNNLVIKEVSRVDSGEFDTILRRMFMVILSVAEDSLEALKSNDKEWLKAIILRDKDTNKLADFCRRILNTSSDMPRTAPLYYIAEQLEKIGDTYTDICKHYSETDITAGKELQNFYQSANDFLREFYNLYYSFDLKKMAGFGRKRYQLRNDFDAINKKITQSQTKAAYYLHYNIEQIFNMNGPLMAAKL